MPSLPAKISESLEYLKSRISINPTIGIILGSGLGPFADTLEEAQAVTTTKVPHYPASTVEGHSGQLVAGLLRGKQILAVKGRVHFYEGYNMEEVTYCVRLMAAMGVKTLIVTNAAGGLNRNFLPGDLMIITSHINWFFANPLQGINEDSLGPRFPDMESEYDRSLGALTETIALERGIRTQRGVYCAHSGPTYETPAEVRMFQKMGVDAVGMSTIPEVIVAKHQGMRVLGISCITNLGTGISTHKLSHNEVTVTANRVKESFQGLLTEVIGRMD